MNTNYKCNHFYESRTTTPKNRLNKFGWLFTHECHKKCLDVTNSKVVLIGDSIIKNLSYFKDIWHNYFGVKGFINCGIGGDQVQNVLWRVKDLRFPKTIKHVFLNCGTNNLSKDTPIEIVNGILAIGMHILEQNEGISVLVSGILPRESASSNKRGSIEYVNHYLEKFCNENARFHYLDMNEGWTETSGELKSHFFIFDKLHLTKAGNEELASRIITSLNHVSVISKEIRFTKKSDKVPKQAENFPPLQARI